MEFDYLNSSKFSLTLNVKLCQIYEDKSEILLT